MTFHFALFARGGDGFWSWFGIRYYPYPYPLSSQEDLGWRLLGVEFGSRREVRTVRLENVAERCWWKRDAVMGKEAEEEDPGLHF